MSTVQQFWSPPARARDMWRCPFLVGPQYLMGNNGEKSDGAEETVIDDSSPDELSDAPSVKAVDKPKPKPKPHKALKKASTISNKKPVAKEVVEESSESMKDKKIVLLVLQAGSEGSQWLSLTCSEGMHSALRWESHPRSDLTFRRYYRFAGHIAQCLNPKAQGS
ncbi:hypothetical protein BKA93DRAFT_750441 [Sparassis latifolia]